MTFEELYTLLNCTDIPIKRIKSGEIFSLPYMVVSEGQKEFRGSDKEILITEFSPVIELYTDSDDYTSADTLTQLLVSHNIRFSYTDDIQIENEDLYVRYFYLEKIIYKI